MAPNENPPGLLDDLAKYRKVLIDATTGDSEGSPLESDITKALNEIDERKQFLKKAILASSRIGVALNRLRLTKEDEGAASLTSDHRKLATRLLAFLKKLTDEENKAIKVKNKTTTDANDDTPTNREGNKAEKVKPFKYLGPDQVNTRRYKTVTMLLQAFDQGLQNPKERREYDETTLSKLIFDIEEAMYDSLGGIKADAYFDCLRALKANISDRSNPDFRKSLYCGVVPTADIPALKSTDMASREKQLQRDAHKRDALEACQSDWDMRNVEREEGQFPCGKCRSKKTTYFQMQTRSSDEPMTTYVTCNNCGNRWKF